jgi:hypothetical protein
MEGVREGGIPQISQTGELVRWLRIESEIKPEALQLAPTFLILIYQTGSIRKRVLCCRVQLKNDYFLSPVL